MILRFQPRNQKNSLTRRNPYASAAYGTREDTKDFRTGARRASERGRRILEYVTEEGASGNTAAGEKTSIRSSEEGHKADALALGAEEGRDKLRKAAVRSKYPLTRRYPNEGTQLQ